MRSNSETGHAKNVANFQDLIEFVTGYGATYNPSKSTLQLPQLNALKATAEGNLADVITNNAEPIIKPEQILEQINIIEKIKKAEN